MICDVRGGDFIFSCLLGRGRVGSDMDGERDGLTDAKRKGGKWINNRMVFLRYEMRERKRDRQKETLNVKNSNEILEERTKIMRHMQAKRFEVGEALQQQCIIVCTMPRSKAHIVLRFNW